MDVSDRFQSVSEGILLPRLTHGRMIVGYALETLGYGPDMIEYFLGKTIYLCFFSFTFLCFCSDGLNMLLVLGWMLHLDDFFVLSI